MVPVAHYWNLICTNSLSAFRGITNISIQSTDAPSAVVVGVIRPVNSTYGPGAKMVEIQLKEPVGGVRKICFEASDAYVYK